MKPILVFDTEVYSNYFLAKFRNHDSGEIVEFELYDNHPLDIEGLKSAVLSGTLVGFNSINFDMPIIYLALSGASNTELKDACNDIIENRLCAWQFYDKYFDSEMCIEKYLLGVDHIDLINVAPGVMDSLKIYGGRLHTKKMQDLPYPPDTILTPEQMRLTCEYCGNDLQETSELYDALKPEIELRIGMGEKYGGDFRSKSRPQMAEAIILGLIEKLQDAPVKRSPIKPGYKFKYKPPEFITFQSEKLKSIFTQVCSAEFVVQKNGTPFSKEFSEGELSKPFSIRETQYQMGIGGLHSCESSVARFSDDDTILIDRDVNSYYPSIILVCELFPKHIGEVFLEVYRDLVKQRLYAKESGDKSTAEKLKTAINGTFGKLGSYYSKLFAPDLMLQVTLTGQLSLLMLIEALELNRIPVVSANTDGVVIASPRADYDMVSEIVAWWEEVTGFSTEETRYAMLCSRDVNNYVAVKTDGKIKTKGLFAPTGLEHNPANAICTKAVIDFLVDDTPIEETVRTCTDIRQFVEVRRTTGGAYYGATVTTEYIPTDKIDEKTGEPKMKAICIVEGGTPIGKAIRWYHTTTPVEQLVDGKTGNQVANSRGGIPCMQLPDTLPNDIDFRWYINQSEEMLRTIGLNESELQWKGYF